MTFLSHDTTLNRTVGWNVRIADVTSDEILARVFNYRVFGAQRGTCVVRDDGLVTVRGLDIRQQPARLVVFRAKKSKE